MRKLFLLTLLAAVFYISCKKDPTSGLNYFFYGEKSDNTIFRTSTPSAGFRSLTAKDTLYIIANSGEDNFVIRVVSKGSGVYQAPELDAVSYRTLGGDVIIRTYHLKKDPANILKITSMDNSIIEGTFDLTFQETSKGLTGAPDVFTLSNGRLRTKIATDKYNAESFFIRF